MSDAPALGCAILGAVSAGLYPNIQAAVDAMVHVARVVQPDPHAHELYQRYYRAYKALVSSRYVSMVLVAFGLCRGASACVSILVGACMVLSPPAGAVAVLVPPPLLLRLSS